MSDSSLFHFVTTLLDKIYHQPNDGIAMETYDAKISRDFVVKSVIPLGLFHPPNPELVFVMLIGSFPSFAKVDVRLNHETYDFATYRAMVVSARKKLSLSVERHEELLTWNSPGDDETGAVAIRSLFTFKFKETGEEHKRMNILMGIVRKEDEKQVLAEMFEVHE
jgi:hypothetical protein